MSLRNEILEQPQILSHLLLTQMDEVKKVAREIKKRDVRYVFLAARGTSDNAGRYANYIWGAHNKLPVALATPSLFTFYDSAPNLRDCLVVGISQSGKSPDIINVLEEGKRRNCLTLSITNTPNSPLANVSDFVLNVEAGEEKAVAATKSYTAELMSIAMIATALGDSVAHEKLLKKVPEWIEKVLEQEKNIAARAERYRYMERCIVLGRGFNYCTAFEWSLKMKEMTYVVAEPYSSADFLHGPIAMVERGFPVMAVLPSGKVFDDLYHLLNILKQRKAELMVVSDHEQALAIAQSPVEIPTGIPEWLTPIINIIPAQLFSYYLAVVKGYDPEAPRGLTKVTETL